MSVDAAIRSFFDERLPAAVAHAPTLFELGMSFGFELGEAGRVRVALGSDGLRVERSAADADCSLQAAPADFALLLEDPGRARELFASRRLRIDGRLDVALHLPALLYLATAQPFPGGLPALLGDDTARFLAEDWPERLKVVHGPLGRVGPLADAAPLRDVAALLDVWPHPVRLADRHRGDLVPPQRARELYGLGHHLAFSDVQRALPELRAWLARLFWELKLPISTYARCLVYASPAGVGEGLHFDQNVNVVVQLRGEKLWRVAENRLLRRPTTRYTAAAPQVAPELRLYGPDTLPTSMPAGAQEIRLAPGSVLVLPRGYWHETRALVDSLSLNFTFDQPSWADVLLPEIQRALLRDADWRELATGAGSANARARDAARARLTQLAARLPALLAELDIGSALARLLPSESKDPNS